MRYLSQALVSRRDAIQKGLVDGYAWHQAIWQVFPGRQDDTRDFLFRTDIEETIIRVLLLSSGKPDSAEPFTWQTKAVKPEFLEHAAYRFQVRTNPTMRRSSDSRRLAIYDEPRLRAWFDRKAKAAGFCVKEGSLVVGAPMDETFHKDGHRGKHVAVDFCGVLTVTDRGLFTEASKTGIGSAKAFGHGLLMLQPI